MSHRATLVVVWAILLASALGAWLLASAIVCVTGIFHCAQKETP